MEIREVFYSVDKLGVFQLSSKDKEKDAILMAEVKNAGKKQDILFEELLYKIGGEETESLLKLAHEEHELRE